MVVSCAEDGSLYQWDVATGKRVHETVMKQCAYNDVTMSPDDSNLIYAVGSDKTIKQFKESSLVREVDLHTVTLSTVVLSHDGNMLFSGSTTGRVQSFKFPLTLPGEWLEYKTHGDVITQMKLSLDDNRLVTASRDGSLCFWQVKNIKGQPPPLRDVQFQYAKEILITRSELEDKNRLVFTLQQQVDEIKTESEYQLRLKDNKYQEEARMAKKKFASDMGDLRQNIHKLENEMNNMTKSQEMQLDAMKEANEKAMAEVAEQYKSKLIVEYQKYDNLEEMYNAIKKNYDRKMEGVEKATKEELLKMKEEFGKKLEANEAEVKQHEREGNEKVRAVEEMLRQTEEDADKEILELKTKYEKVLRSERETNVRLRGESGIVKKKLQSVIRDTEDHKSSIQKMTVENQKLHATIRNMEKDIVDLKSEIRNRDETISLKEKKITEQKRHSVELDKNRFVLEHKIEDLRQQILPKDELIIDLRSQIDAMEDELNAVTRTQADLEVAVDEARTKLASTVQELATERKQASKLNVLQSRLYKDLGGLVNILQDAKALKEAVTSICKKYAKVMEGGVSANLEDENETHKALEEVMRQKAFLERQVSSLKNQMEKDKKNHRMEYLRKLRENAFLLEEIAELKRDLAKAHEYQLPSQRRKLMAQQRSQSSASSSASSSDR